MIRLIYILAFAFGFLSCHNQSGREDGKAAADTYTQIKKVDNSRFYTRQDTVLIATEIGDTLKYPKAGFNHFVDNHPEFFEECPDNPDQAYFSDNGKGAFGSEAGRDEYYVLYAYFLKQRNGISEFSRQRKALIDIYSNINSLFQQLEYGGTYFGHQGRRILAYAEYSLYLLPKEKIEINKTYDIKKQKDLYLKSLRQLIEDENEIDFNALGAEKAERTKKLNKIVDELERLITDNFYLRRAQQFHYRYYEYY